MTKKEKIAKAMGKILEKNGWSVWDSVIVKCCSCGKNGFHGEKYCSECGSKMFQSEGCDEEITNVLNKTFKAGLRVHNADV